jgi:uncharacterized protein with HEPN domain
MRPEVLYLVDIVEAADAIARFLADASRHSFLNDEMRQSAVLQKLIVIGEAAARLPSAFRNEHPHVPWVDIIGFRNIAVHEYFAVSWPIVWVTATQDVPSLRSAVSAILADEFDIPSSSS